MGGSQDPLAVDEGAATEVAPAAVQAGLPRPVASRGGGPAHNSAVEWRDAANWGAKSGSGYRQTGRYFQESRFEAQQAAAVS